MTRYTAILLLLVATTGRAEPDEEDWRPPQFLVEGRALGEARPAAPTPAYLASSRIAAVDDGALVIDADSGVLVRTDHAGKRVGALAIGRDAGLLAYDPATHRAFVADRRGDRIVVASVGDGLEVVRTWPTPVEPYGVALAPDRDRVLVTCVADRVLVAYDLEGHETWRVALSAEPRGVAISPDGKRAIVGSLASGGADEIALEAHRAHRVALPAVGTQSFGAAVHEDVRSRGAYAVAFLGNRVAVTAFQREIPRPVPGAEEVTSSYGGGGFLSPVTSALGFVRDDGAIASIKLGLVLTRALAWDAAHDVLYVAGMADGRVFQIEHASQFDIALRTEVSLGSSCGPDGLAIAGDGSVFVWCALSRSVQRIDAVAKDKLVDEPVVRRGPELAPSSLNSVEHAGMAIFHTVSFDVSRDGGVACASCHQDGRADGVSWRIEHKDLQTPMLAGRIAETAPYKWDGTAKDLETSLRQTVRRLGGSGLGRRDIRALAAYVRSIPAVRTPTRDREAVARGKTLFDSSELGCASCHEGAALTDQITHHFTGTLRAVDTPGLGGLAASAPYFHDGSATTLEAVIRDRGGVHGMADAARELTDAQVADLTAYLETL